MQCCLKFNSYVTGKKKQLFSIAKKNWLLIYVNLISKEKLPTNLCEFNLQKNCLRIYLNLISREKLLTKLCEFNLQRKTAYDSM
jgi:hypothetical protein